MIGYHSEKHTKIDSIFGRMLFLFALEQKFPNPTGYQRNQLELHSEVEIEKFLDSHEYSFLVFHDHQYHLNWMDYAMYSFQDKVGFAGAPTNFGEKYNCSGELCCLAFHQHQSFEPPSWILHNTVHFANFFRQIEHPDYFEVKTPEGLRSIIDSISSNYEENTIFAVDVSISNRPSFIREDEFLVVTTATAFGQFNVTEVTPGYWYFRAFDRQLLPYSGAFEKSPFFSPEKLFDTMKPYIGILVLDERNGTLCQKPIEILNRLAADPQYKDEIDFSIVTSKEATDLLTECNIRKVIAPAFIFASADDPRYRWLAQCGDESNYNFVTDLIETAFKNDTAPTVPSEKPFIYGADKSDLTFRQIAGSQVEKAVLDPENDVVLSVTASWCGHCAHYKPVANVTSMLLKDQPVKFYWLDGPRNDFPQVIPTLTGYPSVLFYPRNNKSNPIKIKDIGSIEGIIDTMNSFTSEYHNYTLPENYNEREAMKMIRAIEKANKNQK